MIRDMLRRFMYGRYGADQLSVALLALYLILLALSWICGLFLHGRLLLLELLAFGVMAWSMFRMLSRNFYARQAENAWFMKRADPVLRWFRLQRSIRRDKEHRYFKCPSCGQQLRVPRGKGRITVTCRGCGAKFEEKS